MMVDQDEDEEIDEGVASTWPEQMNNEGSTSVTEG